MQDKPLTLQERWAIDIEMAKKGYGFQVLKPQCDGCQFQIPKSAKYCKKFQDISKPSFVRKCIQECPEFQTSDPLKITISNQYEDYLYGGIFGFCVGDALGVPVEFSSRQERDADPVSGMRAYGAYHQPLGTWSDDTS